MQKKMIVLFVLLIAFVSLAFTEESKKAPAHQREIVIKTYFTNHITAREVEKSLGPYLHNLTAVSHDSNMFTVKIENNHIAEFERLLKKIDVEKKDIRFRVFTVIASNEGNGESIKNKDLQRVLKELRGVLSFQSYHLDGVSMMNLKENSGENILMLSTKLPRLRLRIRNVFLKGTIPGKRSIQLKGLELSERERDLIETSTSIDENGYLVAGVSSVGEKGDALILIINAEIK